MSRPPHAPIRRTKIVATLGPASDRDGVLDALIGIQKRIIQRARSLNRAVMLSAEDDVILTRSDHMNAHGGTNALKILQVS